jgi:xylono-1,5-lactonase
LSFGKWQIFKRNNLISKIFTILKIIQIKKIVSCQCLLGEGPVWFPEKRLLYWVDILENKIFCYSPSTQKYNFWLITEHIGFILITDNNQIIGGLKSGLHFLTLNKDGTSSKKRIDRIDTFNKRIRFNDGMMDEEGGVICCSMDMAGKENLGKYFYYDRNQKRKIIDKGYVIANGPALSARSNFLYTVESVGNQFLKKGIYVSEFNRSKEKTTNRKLLIDWRWKSSPDGVVTDKNGDVWVGEFGGNNLRCFGFNGNLKTEIGLPAWNITKATFDYKGKNTSIYVTSAKFSVSKNKLKMFPDTGDVLEIICQL